MGYETFHFIDADISKNLIRDVSIIDNSICIYSSQYKTTISMSYIDFLQLSEFIKSQVAKGVIKNNIN